MMSQPHAATTASGSTRRRVCVVGGGAAGLGCAWSLVQGSSGNCHDVVVLEAGIFPGGVASTETLHIPGDGGVKVEINDGVQGGASSYRNTLMLMKQVGLGDPRWVDMKVSFGTGASAWNNFGGPSPLHKAHAEEIKRFGAVLRRVASLEWLYALVPVRAMLRWHGFSDRFANDMVYPLVALFFGTGNQTAHVSSALFARVFNDDKLRLYEYDSEKFLSEAPKMFAFPSFNTYYGTLASAIEEDGKGKVCCGCTVTAVRRYRDRVEVVYRRRKCHSGDNEVDHVGDGHTTHEETEETVMEVFDDIVFACSCEVTKRVLDAGTGTSWMERLVFGGVAWFDDVTVTHTDAGYMKRHYEVDTSRDEMYFVRTYEEHQKPDRIEMSFDLSSYQFDDEGNGRSSPRIYQSIFLNRNEDGKMWTMDAIDKDKVLLVKWWRQFSHTVRQAINAPLWRFIQGSRRTYHAGSYTLVNTHEIALISGLAAAHRIGAPYPFGDDALAAEQFDMYTRLVHGRRTRNNTKTTKSRTQNHDSSTVIQAAMPAA